MICVAHWDRRGESVPAHRLGLCHDCWAGKALSLNANARPIAEAAARFFHPLKKKAETAETEKVEDEISKQGEPS
jgi:hypothetical protein